MKDTANDVSKLVKTLLQLGYQDVANEVADDYVSDGRTLHFDDRKYKVRFTRLCNEGLTFKGRDWQLD